MMDITCWDDDRFVEWCQARGIDTTDSDARDEAAGLYHDYLAEVYDDPWGKRAIRERR